MTKEGIKRLLQLFKEDIKCITYTVNKELKTKKDFDFTITDNNELFITTTIEDKEIGTLNNFKLISKGGIEYANKLLNFKKDSGIILIEFPFKFVLEEV